MTEHVHKVLLVSPLVSTVMGGIAKWTENIMSYYSMASSSKIVLLPCYNENIQNPLGKDNLIVRIKKGINNYVPLLRKVSKELDNEQIDVIHICSSASIGLIKDILLIKMAKRKGVKSIIHFHFGRIPAIFSTNNWEHLLITKVIECSDKVIVMDKASYRTLEEYGYKHISYVPNPLSLDTQALIEKNKDIKRTPGKVVFVGQMLETKGIFELAEACKEIKNIKVNYIGPVPNAEVTERLRALIGSDKLEICGARPFEDVIKEMLSAAVFVLPTYSEGFPNVIIESMACGCPIVTTPVGAIPEMLNYDSESRCGICVPVKDVNNLKAAISNMLNNPEKAEEMGKRAKERVNEEYSIQKVWRQLENLWL